MIYPCLDYLYLLDLFPSLSQRKIQRYVIGTRNAAAIPISVYLNYGNISIYNGPTWIFDIWNFLYSVMCFMYFFF